MLQKSLKFSAPSNEDDSLCSHAISKLCHTDRDHKHAWNCVSDACMYHQRASESTDAYSAIDHQHLQPKVSSLRRKNSRRGASCSSFNLWRGAAIRRHGARRKAIPATYPLFTSCGLPIWLIRHQRTQRRTTRRLEILVTFTGCTGSTFGFWLASRSQNINAPLAHSKASAAFRFQ